MQTRCGLPFTIDLLHPKHWMVWLGLGIAAILSICPVRVRHGLGAKIGTYIYNHNKKRRHIVDTNLSIAFPYLSDGERNEMALAHLKSYGCALVDYSLVFFASKRRLAGLSEIQGREHIEVLQQQQQTIMLLLAHSVMLEFAPAEIGRHYDIFGSYKTLKNPVIDWMVARSRCRQASFVVSRDEGLRKLVKSMSPKRMMIFLPDEDLGRDNAVFAPFYRTPKATLSTTARLARMGKAKALPVFTYYHAERRKYVTVIGSPLVNYPSKDAIADATRMNQALEALIAEQPQQYMWFMKWYKTRPEGESSFY